MGHALLFGRLFDDIICIILNMYTGLPLIYLTLDIVTKILNEFCNRDQSIIKCRQIICVALYGIIYTDIIIRRFRRDRCLKNLLYLIQNLIGIIDKYCDTNVVEKANLV